MAICREQCHAGISETQGVVVNLKIGDVVRFHGYGEEEVLEGVYKRRMPPYYLVETGTSRWRILETDIISVNGAAVEKQSGTNLAGD